MRNKRNIILFAILSIFIGQVSLLAHHGNAAYGTTDVTMKGVVVELVLANPHSFIKLDVKDEKGEIVHWTIESSAASVNLPKYRLTKDTLKPGDEITVTMIVAKNGRPYGRIHKIVLPNGQVMETDLP